DVQRRLTDVMAFFNPLLQTPVTAQGAGQAGPSVATSHLQQIVQRIKVDLPAVFEVLNRVKPLPEDVSFDTLVQMAADVFKLGLTRRYVYLSPDLIQANPQVNSVPGLYFGADAMFPGL